MNRIAVLASFVLLALPGINGAAYAVQSTEDPPEVRAHSAMDRGDYIQAISLLSEALALRPSADLFLSLGNSYRHTRDWQKAEDALNEGANRFPTDPRLQNELANAYLDAGDIDAARAALLRALNIDPGNAEAADRIATVELSQGEVQAALRFWNRSGGPIVANVLHNSNLTFGHWTVHDAEAFHSGQMMTYAQWRTTELRLLETGIFSNDGIDIEPAPGSDRYNPIILTTEKTNDLANTAFGILKGAPLETSYFDWWNAANSGITLNSSYRWDYNRRRGELQLHAPIPVPGILYLTASGLWRSERWNLSRVLRTDAGASDRFQYDSTGVQLELKYIPQYRIEVGGGFEYTNRNASGGLPQWITDSRNSGKVLLQGSVRLADTRFQNRIHVESAFARKRILGDLNYSTATVEINNRFLISKDTDTVFTWTVKGGASGGQLPIEEYFTLGVDTQAGNLLRAHPASEHGQYGNSPMGTSFALSNMDVERRVAILPLFNTLNIPYLDVKLQAFADSGKTFDRERIFNQGILYIDAGAGLKFETPTHALNLIYARSLREGRDGPDGSAKRNVLFAYIEKRW